MLMPNEKEIGRSFISPIKKKILESFLDLNWLMIFFVVLNEMMVRFFRNKLCHAFVRR